MDSSQAVTGSAEIPEMTMKAEVVSILVTSALSTQ
jgi:hypothetical protein